MENDILKVIPITIDMIDCLLESNEAFYNNYGLINDGGEFLVPSKNYLLLIRKRMIERKEEYPLAVDHLIVLKSINTVIGSIYYKYLPKDGVSEIGYGMNNKYEGHGYMTSALKLMIEYGKANGIEIIKADTLIQNKKSQNVLLRNGFNEDYRDDKNIYFIRRND
ncbi:MAG: GNAT family N-acetyltransferase [Bacilli bacterium]|jgi:RimJ/RimL family protein N-acetyltransferase|nr:GNAT family N-acetyltransferase [Bacilli bacterium]